MQLDLLTLFAEAIPASHFLQPGSAEARKMTVTSGQKCIGSWLPSGPVGCLLKTLLATSAWASTKCYLTWKAKATPAGRLLFQLAPSMPNIEGIGSGLLPMMVAYDATPGGPNNHYKGLGHKAKHRQGGSLHSGNQLPPCPGGTSGGICEERARPSIAVECGGEDVSDANSPGRQQ